MFLKTLTFAVMSFWLTAVTAQDVTKDLYVFDFGLNNLSIPQRTKLLVDLGYKGVTFTVTNDNQLQTLATYLDTEEVKSGALSIPVTYYVHRFNFNEDMGPNPRWKRVLNTLPTDTKFWVIFDKTGTRQQVKDLLLQMSAEAKKIDKEIIMYPHDGHFVDNAEDAVSYIKELNLDNVFVTVHLCHELREGNGNRMDEVLTNVAPYLKFVSVSGALQVINDGSSNWSDAIRPLDDSEYDLENFVSILQSINYSGGIVLHTFGISRPPADHLTASLNVWENLVEKTNTLSINQNYDDNATPIQDITLTPIPVKDQIQITIKKPNPIEIGLFDMLGQELYRKKITAEKDHIPMHYLSPGSYLLKISAEGKQEVRSILKI